MKKSAKSYQEDLLKRLQNPDYAAEYLNAALADEDPSVFLTALKDIADAQGVSVATIARKARLNRESLYRTLSDKGNPRLHTLCLILVTLGLRLSVTCEKPERLS